MDPSTLQHDEEGGNNTQAAAVTSTDDLQEVKPQRIGVGGDGSALAIAGKGKIDGLYFRLMFTNHLPHQPPTTLSIDII